MIIDFAIKQNTTTPDIEARLADGNGAVDLTGASVLFVMRSMKTGTVKVSHAATVLVADPSELSSASAPNVVYEWLPADTNTAGLYEAEWRVTYADGQTQRFPTEPRRRYTTIEVQKAL
jgi:hypothetical protein